MVISTSAGKFIAATWEWHYAVIGTLVMSLVVCAALILVLPRTGATDIPATEREQMPLLRDPRIIAGTAIFMFGVGSIYVFYGYVTPYLENILGMGTLEASGALMAYGGMCFASNLLSGWCDARFGVKTMLVELSDPGSLALRPLGGRPRHALGPRDHSRHRPHHVRGEYAVHLSVHDHRRRGVPRALTLASSLEPTAFNVGIAFGTAVGGAVISGPGMPYVGLVGAAFSLVAWALAAITVRLATKRR